MGGEELGILLPVVAFFLLVFWAVQLADLMGKRDDEFPGKYDKLAWIFILVVTFVAGAGAYYLWKRFQVRIGPVSRPQSRTSSARRSVPHLSTREKYQPDAKIDLPDFPIPDGDDPPDVEMDFPTPDGDAPPDFEDTDNT